MATYTIPPDKLSAAMQAEGAKQTRAVNLGAVAAARRFEALLVTKTKAAGKVDQGQFLAGWRTVVRSLSDARGVAAVSNDAPHAGIIELGARPHSVSAEGREALARWFMRKHGLDEKSAKAAAVGLARKIRKYGQKGTFLVRDNMGEASQFLAIEIGRRLKGKP
jgi:hypothetical protein